MRTTTERAQRSVCSVTPGGMQLAYRLIVLFCIVFSDEGLFNCLVGLIIVLISCLYDYFLTYINLCDAIMYVARRTCGEKIISNRN